MQITFFPDIKDKNTVKYTSQKLVIHSFHVFQNPITKRLFKKIVVGKSLVCVTEQHYASIFFTRLWSVRKPLRFDTQNPEMSGFSTADAYKYKTKRQAKMKRNSRKVTFLLISHQKQTTETLINSKKLCGI